MDHGPQTTGETQNLPAGRQARNAKRKTRNAKRETQNAKRKTQNAKRETTFTIHF